MTTTARRQGAHYLINGCKHWITGGGVSKLYLIFARVIGENGVDQGIGGFIVHRDPESGLDPEDFKIVRHERTMGLCGMPDRDGQ